jgi:predicted nuclease with TOPRIM domain
MTDINKLIERLGPKYDKCWMLSTRREAAQALREQQDEIERLRVEQGQYEEEIARLRDDSRLLNDALQRISDQYTGHPYSEFDDGINVGARMARNAIAAIGNGGID